MSENNVHVTFDIITGNLVITVTGQGKVLVLPRKTVYVYGDRITLYAIPTVGWQFTGWSGAVTGTINPVSFIFK